MRANPYRFHHALGWLSLHIVSTQTYARDALLVEIRAVSCLRDQAVIATLRPVLVMVSTLEAEGLSRSLGELKRPRYSAASNQRGAA